MCNLNDGSRSDYYEWCYRPLSNRTIEDARQLPLTRASHGVSFGIYGHRRISMRLKEKGVTCIKHRVHLIRKANHIGAIHL